MLRAIRFCFVALFVEFKASHKLSRINADCEIAKVQYAVKYGADIDLIRWGIIDAVEVTL